MTPINAGFFSCLRHYIEWISRQYLELGCFSSVLNLCDHCLCDHYLYVQSLSLLIYKTGTVIRGPTSRSFELLFH